MAFSNLKLSQVKEKYGLTSQYKDLFLNLQPLEPTQWLSDMIVTANEVPLNSEKAKSEFIVMPILVEIWKKFDKKFSIFSGVSLDVDTELKGECDFILSNSPKSVDVEAPIFTLIEAKDDNIRLGIGQCVAQMYAAQKFNEIRKKPLDSIYGCVTTGESWQFIKLENNVVTLNDKYFYLSDLNKILGIFHSIIKEIIK
jgi:hypothetical protein